MSARAGIDWRAGGPPRSARFGDIYFSAGDGLAEAKGVFLAGCGLPQRWRGRRNFIVAELGFGTGLNIAALLDLWAREGPRDGHLSIFSVEAFPMARDDAARALAAWPELTPVSAPLLAAWPGVARGFHRLDLPGLNATLDVGVMEAAEALRQWRGLADAWFLDGFSPSANPEMWRPEVLTLVAEHSAPGARLASYSVAGQVRRGLAAAGFSARREAGVAGKRQRLEADGPGSALPDRGRPSVAVVGAGIAGAALKRAFDTLGVSAALFDTSAPAASRAPTALVSPRLDAGLGPPAALFARAFARAVALYGAVDGAAIARGVLQLAVGPKDSRRFAAIAGSELFEPGEVARLGAIETAARLGEPAPAALAFARALAVTPASVLTAWAGEARQAEVAGLEPGDDGWRLKGAAGATLAVADIVCLACGMDCARLAPSLELRAVRGQASLAPGVTAPASVLFGGYAAPAPGGTMFGATHDRDDESLEVRAADHQRNLATVGQVLPGLAGRLAQVRLEAFTGVRATTADYLPLAGAVPGQDGLHVLGGLGSRGFTLAPLLAEHIAACALGAPSPLQGSLADLVDPARFERRRERRA